MKIRPIKLNTDKVSLDDLANKISINKIDRDILAEKILSKNIITNDYKFNDTLTEELCIRNIDYVEKIIIYLYKDSKIYNQIFEKTKEPFILYYNEFSLDSKIFSGKIIFTENYVEIMNRKYYNFTFN